MIYEEVGNMSREQVEIHPLLDYENLPDEYIKGLIKIEGDIETDDYFTLFLILASQHIFYAEEDGDNIIYLLSSIKRQLDRILKIVEVETSTLYDAGEYMQPTMLKFLLEYFWDSEYRDIIIDGILNLDEDYEHERQILGEILHDHFDDHELMIGIAKHPNWRLIKSTIEDSIDQNGVLKVIYIMEECDEVIDEFNLIDDLKMND